MIDAIGYSAASRRSDLARTAFQCDEPGAHDVQIAVDFCGVCHSDIHQARNEWGNTVYPCMPGHELVGRVSRVGSAVTRHAVGDRVGVGCMIDSCRQCEACRAGDENYCEGPNSWLATYNGPMIPRAKAGDNMYGCDNTFGGYATVKVGFGGLGDMATKIARAMGAAVTVFTTSPEKASDARAVGAERVVTQGDQAAMAALKGHFDFLLATIPQSFDLNPFLPVLKRDGAITVVGALDKLKPVNNMVVAGHRLSVAGSLIGSIRETQEVLDFCAERGIGPDVQVIDIADVNAAYQRVIDGDVRYRYVIDLATLH